ncbi:hypothetical protein LOTGIDRAFT_77036, partial [Lottia gigantea]
FQIKRFKGSDEDIRFWTGFYSYESFKLFWTHFVEKNSQNIRCWGVDNAKTQDSDLCGPKRKLLPIDELFMVLLKLKRGSAIKDIAERFGIHETHVSRIFITWINILHKILSAVDI